MAMKVSLGSTHAGMLERESEHARALRRALAAPIFNDTLGKDVGTGKLDYEVYLRTQELLTLQTSGNELVTHDELAFQVTHQTQELWLKLLAFEAVALIDALDCDDLWRASGILLRMTLTADA
ncbi:MAG: Tryptophan 2,3-dioxygenase, partial [Myxococcaceae bacterium]|nr:Tryptophan 2,3-dioxygenase [Myxococcaceae bacterium]